MYKIEVKNIVVPLILLIVSILLSISVGFVNLPLPLITVPAWLLVGVALALFIIASVMLYARANVTQYFMLAGLMLLSYIITMAVAFGVATVIQSKNIINLEGMNLSISLVTLIIPIFLSIAFAKTLIEFKAQTKESVTPVEPEKVESRVEGTVEEPPGVKPVDLEKQSEHEQALEEVPIDQAPPAEIETVQVEAREIEAETPVQEQTPPREVESTEEIFFEDIIEEKPPVTSEEPAPPIQEEQPEEEIYFEDIATVNFSAETETESTKVEDLSQQEPVVEEIQVEVTEKVVYENSSQPETPQEELNSLDVLPDLEGELGDLTFEQTQPSDTEEKPAPELVESEETEKPSLEDIPPAEPQKAPDQKITDDDGQEIMPKLTESPRSKDLDAGGKITAIGKLLVDHRDIENIIETNALMQSVGAEATTTNIISAIAGGKTNEKLSAITELEGIQSVVVVNEAGFIKASTLGDIHKEQVIGAMASGTFGIINKTMNKLKFNSVKDVSFESETGTITLNKTLADIVAVFVEPSARLYNLSEINDLLSTAAELSHGDIVSSFSSFNGILGVVIASAAGDLLAGKIVDDAKNPAEIAAILPAFYSNLGVFIKNMDQGSLRKAIIATNSEMLLLTTIGANILMVYATLNTAVIPEDIKLQYETILQS
jgi:predicted regulator of Ras-like GTPase activity (Roadblock/LC7/MglB family)